MPDTTLTEAIREALVSAPVGVVLLVTLTLEHPNLDAPIYMVQDSVAHDLTLETGETVTFEPVPFRLRLPGSGGNTSEITIEIDNIERQGTDFVAALRGSEERVVVTYRPYLSNDSSTPQATPLEFYLTDATVDSMVVRGKASVADVVNRGCPNIYYTADRFPGLSSQ